MSGLLERTSGRRAFIGGALAGSAVLVSGPTHGTLTLNANGSFTYTPPAGVSGAVGFTYQVCLPAPFASTCSTATVTINVNTGTLLAADDDFSGAPVLPGGTTPSVLANDSLNGVSPPAAGNNNSGAMAGPRYKP